VNNLSERRSLTSTRIQNLQAKLHGAEKRISGKACVYATGSFGRGESGLHSDLDLFIVGKRNGECGPDGREGSLLSRLDDICVKADLIEVTRKLGIPEFSGDGRYLVHYSVHDFTKTLGTPEDDASNTFTARLLLLLESRPLLEANVYQEIIEEVTTAYWRDYEDHKSDFKPAFLANDILRLWRTFCVNYEARTERMSDDKKAKGKVKNYKLKHSRLLTCYSALLYLLAIYRREGTVHPEDALKMIKSTPTERLGWLAANSEFSEAHNSIHELLDLYDNFLEATNLNEAELTEKFKDKETSKKAFFAARKFGDAMFEALSKIGGNTDFHRLLVV
jgi:predicted nucleotidyltransferase